LNVLQKGLLSKIQAVFGSFSLKKKSQSTLSKEERGRTRVVSGLNGRQADTHAAGGQFPTETSSAKFLASQEQPE
jgi:hypothetical protein